MAKKEWDEIEEEIARQADFDRRLAELRKGPVRTIQDWDNCPADSGQAQTLGDQR